MKTIQDSAAFAFVIGIAILTVVSVLGIWDVFGEDVIWKSFQTVGLLALVAVVIMVASKFLGYGSAPMAAELPNPAFGALRKMTISILIASAGLLALLGVLSIWEIVTDKDVLYKSIGSLSVLAFGAFLMVATCMEREKSPLLKSSGVSIGGVIGGLILLYLIFAFSGLFD